MAPSMLSTMGGGMACRVEQHMVLSVSEIRNHHDWAKPGPIVSPTTDHGSDYQRRNLDNLGNMLAAENALVRKMPGDNCDAIYLLPVLPDCVPVPVFCLEDEFSTIYPLVYGWWSTNQWSSGQPAKSLGIHGKSRLCPIIFKTKQIHHRMASHGRCHRFSSNTSMFLLVLNVGNGWEWRLLGLLLIVSQWIIPEIPDGRLAQVSVSPTPNEPRLVDLIQLPLQIWGLDMVQHPRTSSKPSWTRRLGVAWASFGGIL